MTGDFFAGERRSRSVLPTQLAAPVESPAPESVLDRMRLAHLAAKSLEPVRPPIRAFVDAVGVPWNTELAGIRWRPVFGTPDFEWGHLIAIGPQARTIPAPAAPGLLHVLSGRVALRVDGDGPIGATAGTTVAIAPGERVEIDFGDRPSSAPPLHAIWIRWAPEADLGYWARDYFLTEPVPENGDSPSLRRDIEFFPSEDEAHRP